MKISSIQIQGSNPAKVNAMAWRSEIGLWTQKKKWFIWEPNSVYQFKIQY